MLTPSSLRPAKRNARTHNEAQIDLLANSILHFGVIRPVVIDDRNRDRRGPRRLGGGKKARLEAEYPLFASRISQKRNCVPMRSLTISSPPKAVGTASS